MTQYQLDKLVEIAYKTAVDKGFHDKPLNVGEKVALIVGELGECLEAFRIGKVLPIERLDYPNVINLVNKDTLEVDESFITQEDFVAIFKAHVKDTNGDEIADVAVRLFDLASSLGIQIQSVDEMGHHFDARIKGENVGDDLLTLMKAACKVHTAHKAWVFRKYRLKAAFANFFALIAVFCWEWGIDLEAHIYHKMVFNKTRARLHGNKQF